MPLRPGYNIVSEPVAETNSSLAALEFFRQVANNESIETPVTVTGLEDLLYNSAENERSDVLGRLRQALRDTGSIGSMDAVQLHVDGKLVDDVEFRVRIEKADGGVYLDIGQLFVEAPQLISPTHAVARK
ncbi:hypothetical protein [Halanaeroarchaeum sulfurireducens]|uniref:DUF8076 domain-containing protein n=1 Tax=Halanaeroarchaeum sulfurireducens TaxID=1604004 RepID=A0A0F7PDU5_9EURY|nr:hypothetical protein [Halanaeroarchaeum sulfurireducens]AKH97513.1 hypothetical protein HLASF_1024 [Halanaeroarchaeum sulfurireducens]ALG81909.1 hypothetical protein HLASA_1013 [Halanaeroarchaeum sulfurireducens]